ncbi:MAG: segregation/condensation protein A [Myxococcota bacterium]
MTRRIRAWWKKVRGQVSALWNRVFGRASGGESRGLSAPMPEPVVESAPKRADSRDPSPTVVADAEWIEAAESDAARSAAPETGGPDAAGQDTAAPDVAVPDTVVPDTATPDTERDVPLTESTSDTNAIPDATELASLLPQEPANRELDPPVAPHFPKERRRGRTGKSIVAGRSRADGPRPTEDEPSLTSAPEETEELAERAVEEPEVEELGESVVAEREAETLSETMEDAPVAGPVNAVTDAAVDSEPSQEGSPAATTSADLEAIEPVLDSPAAIEPEDAEWYGPAVATEERLADAEAEPVDLSEWAEPASEQAVVSAEAERAEAPEETEGAAETPDETEAEVLAEAETNAEPDGVAGAEAADEVRGAADAQAGEVEAEAEVTDEELTALESELAAAEDAALAAAELELPKPRRRSKRERLASHELQCWRQLAESELKRRARAAAEPVAVPNDYVPMAESAELLFQLNLSSFEGPLDLLLFLIRRHKIDIFDIPIGFISAQYLRYIKMMEDLNIDVASEFLFMASELLHIKSRMLLPKPAEVDDEDDIDPRAELVQRLLEYQKYKQAASELHEFAWLGRDTFPRAPEKLPPREGEAPLKEVGVFALIEAFNRVLERQKPEVRHQVLLEQVSVRQRIKQVIQLLVDADATPFVDLLEGLTDRVDIVVTFLACLEMGKRQLLRLYLSETETLYLQPRFDDIELAMGRLEGLDEHEYA